LQTLTKYRDNKNTERSLKKRDLSDEKDIRLFEKVRQGSVDAFEKLFRSYYPELMDYCTRIVTNSQEAEEIVQDLFFTMWNKKEDLNIHSSVRSYLFRSAHNNCLLNLQRNTVRQRYQDYVSGNEPVRYPDPSESYRETEMAGIIQQALNKLPERTREIFRMSRTEELKYNEIAERLSISVKTVEANMGKALKILRQVLKEYMTVLLFIL